MKVTSTTTPIQTTTILQSCTKFPNIVLAQRQLTISRSRQPPTIDKQTNTIQKYTNSNQAPSNIISTTSTHCQHTVSHIALRISTHCQHTLVHTLHCGLWLGQRWIRKYQVRQAPRGWTTCRSGLHVDPILFWQLTSSSTHCSPHCHHTLPNISVVGEGVRISAEGPRFETRVTAKVPGSKETRVGSRRGNLDEDLRRRRQSFSWISLGALRMITLLWSVWRGGGACVSRGRVCGR